MTGHSIRRFIAEWLVPVIPFIPTAKGFEGEDEGVSASAEMPEGEKLARLWPSRANGRS